MSNGYLIHLNNQMERPENQYIQFEIWEQFWKLRLQLGVNVCQRSIGQTRKHKLTFVISRPYAFCLDRMPTRTIISEWKPMGSLDLRVNLSDASLIPNPFSIVDQSGGFCLQFHSAFFAVNYWTCVKHNQDWTSKSRSMAQWSRMKGSKNPETVIPFFSTYWMEDLPRELQNSYKTNVM